MKEIRLNGKYLVSEDMHFTSEYFDAYEYNESIAEFIQSLIKKDSLINLEYKNILTYLFPYIKKFIENNGYDNHLQYISEASVNKIDKIKYNDSIINKRIYNGRFFDLYFCKTKNLFTELDKTIVDFIDLVNSCDNYNNILNYYVNMLDLSSSPHNVYILELLYIYIKKVNKSKLYDIAKIILITSYNLKPNAIRDSEMGEINIAAQIISSILNMISSEEFNTFIKEFKHQYQNIYLMKCIQEWNEFEFNDFNNDKISETFKLFFDDVKENIIKSKINMYNKKNYSRYNISLLLINDENYRDFVLNSLCPKNIMLFILDYTMINLKPKLRYEFKYSIIDYAYGWDRAIKDIKSLKDSMLKSFLLIAMENAVHMDTLDKTDLCYVSDKIYDIELMINDYLGR